MVHQPAYEHNGQPVNAETFYAIACDPRRSVAVEACAGSGKTWMLVSRIVRALLEGAGDADRDGADGTAAGEVRPQDILAITFTKKAAGEMRQRLDDWLRQFSQADDATLQRELLARGVMSPDQAGQAHNANKNGLQANASGRKQLSNLYRAILATGRSVQIRTFHSWFAALLKSAPVALLQRLGLPVDYELLEDDAPARALVWRRFYAVVSGDALLRADFDAVVLTHGRFQADKALQAALDKRVEFVLADERGMVDGSVAHFSTLFPQFSGATAPHAALDGEAARARWLAWARLLGAEKNKTPQKAAQAVVDAFGQPDLPVRLSGLRKAFFVADEDRLTQHLCKFAAAMEAEPELRALCGARAQHEAWAYQQSMARLTRTLLVEFTAVKRERGWIDMNDVERAALAMLGDGTLSGWVQERLDARIRHLMIDEFQDTNPLQWQALYGWLQSYGGAGRAPSVFLVGDPKQSIYRFRRAEPQVFMAAKAFLREQLGGDLLTCDHTRRNAQAVIGAVNAVMGAAALVDGYEGFRPHTTASDVPGGVGRLPAIARSGETSDAFFAAVATEPVEAGREPGEGPDPGSGARETSAWRDSLTTPREQPEETLRVREARQAARWVAAQIASGVAPEKIMVLSRKRAGLLPLQLELRALHIAAQIGDKTDLIECCEVLDLVALLDVLCSPRHDLSLARALRSPLFGLADASLVQIALLQREQGLSWFESLQKTELLTPELTGLGPCLIKWKGWLDSLPPHDALQRIYDDGDVLARFGAAAPAAQRSVVLANLRALLAVALDQGGGRYATPYGLVRALKAGGTRAPATLDPKSVRLLTIHGAKGLEADAVLLLDTDTPERARESMGVLIDWPGAAAAPEKFVFLVSESRPPACAAASLAAEQAARQREELNALYVALTRARHTVAVSSIEAHRAAPGSWWQRLHGVAVALSAPQSAPQPAPMPEQDLDAAVADSDTGIDTNTNTHSASQHGSFLLPSLPDLPAAPASVRPPEFREPDASATARIGQAMHRLLEWGGRASDAHIAGVQREFLLSPPDAQRAAQMARRILAGDGAWAWQPEVVAWQGNEVDLLHAGQAMRLDRLVQRQDAGHEGHWWVLDYKSAHTPAAQPALVAQLLAYRAAVAAIYPAAVVRAAFLTGQGALVEVI